MQCGLLNGYYTVKKLIDQEFDFMKVCSKCGIEKDESEFNKNKRHKDGLTSECKKCNRIYHKNREKSIERKNTVKKYRTSDNYKLFKSNYQKSEKYKKYKRERNRKKRELYLLSDEYKIIQFKKSENRKLVKYRYNNSEKGKLTRYINSENQNLKKQIGKTPPPELVETKLLILKIKKLLCETSKN